MSVYLRVYEREIYLRTLSEAMYKKSHVNVKVEPRSTFTFTRFSSMSSILFYARTYVKITWSWKFEN